MDLIPADALRALVARATAGGLAVAIHAIGDRALRSALDAFEASGPALRSLALPCRIEHVQIAEPQDLDRFAPLGVAASLQPTHAVSDIEMAERWWGSRIERVYPGATLLKRGTCVAFGSDAPVEPPGAALTLHAAVTRRRANGHPAGGWRPGECFDLDQALSASSEGPARLAGTWPALGRLTVGAHADLVLWDRDLHAADPQELWRAQPRLTLVAGRVVHAEAGALRQREVAA